MSTATAMTRTTATHTSTSAVPNPICPKCGCKRTVKKGKRRNRMQTLQIYECSECLHHFTAGAAGKNKSYPLKTILDAVSTFNLGHSLTETQQTIRRRFHLDIPERTISSWLAEHRPLTTYARLRKSCRQLFSPEAIIRSHTFYHQQVYRFQVHQAKLALLLKGNGHPQEQQERERVTKLADYFASITKNFPHHLFQSAEHRSSKFPTELHPRVERKENHATRLAALALPTSPNNKKRHETLQRFMLINDSVTVAVEIPVYLTQEDVHSYQAQGLNLNFQAEVITGHIDFVQIRNGYVHILDYKPEAKKEKHAHVQLTIYALALARRTGLKLKDFKCAWFDENDYFEFFPLTGVYTGRHKHFMNASCRAHKIIMKSPTSLMSKESELAQP